MMREGAMIGTEVSLADLEKKAEERSGPLKVKVFLEKAVVFEINHWVLLTYRGEFIVMRMIINNFLCD